MVASNSLQLTWYPDLAAYIQHLEYHPAESTTASANLQPGCMGHGAWHRYLNWSIRIPKVVLGFVGCVAVYWVGVCTGDIGDQRFELEGQKHDAYCVVRDERRSFFFYCFFLLVSAFCKFSFTLKVTIWLIKSYGIG